MGIYEIACHDKNWRSWIKHLVSSLLQDNTHPQLGIEGQYAPYTKWWEKMLMTEHDGSEAYF